MFSYFITFDDEFNMKEYDVAQPGLIISIKLSRWHYSVKCLFKSVFRKWSAQVMKNFLPTILIVLCSYSSLYFPVISIDARGTLALLRSLAYISFLPSWRSNSSPNGAT